LEPLFMKELSRSAKALNFKEWSGYYTASVYEMTHEHEYNAIRSTAALIDITPLFKIPRQRPRCQQTRQSRSSPATSQGGHRSGYLLLLVRSPRQGHRRRHHHAPGENDTAGPPPTPASAGSGRTPSAWMCRLKTFPRKLRRSHCKPYLRQTAARRCRTPTCQAD